MSLDKNYKIVTRMDGEEFIILNDISWVPTDTSNSDYQQYLAWLAEGNMAEELITE